MKKTISIRTYLVISHALLLILSLGSIGFIWSQNEYQVITQELQKLMRERVNLISRFIGHELAEEGDIKLANMGPSNEHLEDDMSAVYIDKAGLLYNLYADDIDPQEADLFRELSAEYKADEHSYTTLISSELETTSVYAASPVLDTQNQPIGVVCLLMPIGHLDSYILRLRWMLAGVILIVALLGMGVSSILANYFAQQFSRAQELAATVASGDYQVRIPEQGPTELRDLSHYMNQMAQKLQDQLKMRQTLLANVAHELARPLAGLQLGIESLRKGAIKDPDFADDLLVGMAQTIRNFDGLVDDITLAAQPQTRPIELHCAALPVEPFLHGIATRFWTLAESRGLKLKVQVAAGLPDVYADEKRLNQIIGNLLDNAIKFTPRGKTIRLSAERAAEGTLRILVQDGGKGISAEEIDRIFEPFYQGELGRHIKQGMGLGLAIAQQLAHAHGGSLVLENLPKGGTLAILTLPGINP